MGLGSRVDFQCWHHLAWSVQFGTWAHLDSGQTKHLSADLTQNVWRGAFVV